MNFVDLNPYLTSKYKLSPTCVSVKDRPSQGVVRGQPNGPGQRLVQPQSPVHALLRAGGRLLDAQSAVAARFAGGVGRLQTDRAVGVVLGGLGFLQADCSVGVLFRGVWLLQADGTVGVLFRGVRLLQANGAVGVMIRGVGLLKADGAVGVMFGGVRLLQADGAVDVLVGGVGRTHLHADRWWGRAIALRI